MEKESFGINKKLKRLDSDSNGIVYPIVNSNNGKYELRIITHSKKQIFTRNTYVKGNYEAIPIY